MSVLRDVQATVSGSFQYLIYSTSNVCIGYAHPIGLTTGDQTSFMGGQEDWSEDHLPDLAYQLNPQAENMVLRVQLPAQCTTGNGQLRYGIVIKADGTGVRHPVLDFLILVSLPRMLARYTADSSPTASKGVPNRARMVGCHVDAL